MKKNKFITVVTVIVIFVIAGAVGYFAGTMIYELTHKEDPNTIYGEGVTYQDITESEATNIINEELYVLWDKVSMGTLTAQDKLQVALEQYVWENNLESKFDVATITKDQLEAAFKNTSIAHLGLKHQSILGYFRLTRCDHEKWTYDEATGIYTQTSDGHGVTDIAPVYTKQVKSNKEGGRFVVVNRYIFGVSSEDGLSDKFYASYEDANEGINPIATIEITDPEQSNTVIKEYFDKKYKSLEDKLDTYTYTFEKTNNKIKLFNFVRS